MAPSVFLIRHDIKLTENGEKEALLVGNEFVGPEKHINPSTIARVFVSPRIRARETFEFAVKGFPEIREKVIFDERFREWDHGRYEGKTTEEIKELRASEGLDKSSTWSIWTGGCDGGESVEDMSNRVEEAIAMVQEIQKYYMDNESYGNVMIVGHGTFLRCFWKIWGGLPISSAVNIRLDTGTVATLSYEQNDVKKRIIPVGFKGRSR
ncbi:hypothetical protein FHETE_10190 [Fusarium heterosporum]|uniref:Phosphoglycerate mutase n=1 Tax=Fusarium heterosporum TaxID=42747 RepID=A0A8H5WGP3_FUSHE|nr:hypothetical protein FHETE_10190 [Fusarium heterosporum]